MVSRADSNGVLRTEPTETHRDDSGAIALPVANDAVDAEAWNTWFSASFRNFFEPERDSLLEAVGKALVLWTDKRVGPLEQKIHDLELKLAAATGAIDMLRTIGSGGINHRGAYDAGTSYARHDACMLDGSSFLAIRDHAGPCPGPGWRLLASAGRRGEKGRPGPRGEAVKVKWLSIDNSNERLALVVIMSDGTSTKLPLAGIFKSVRVDPSDYSIKFAMHDGGELSFSLRSLFAQYDDEKRGY